MMAVAECRLTFGNLKAWRLLGHLHTHGHRPPCPPAPGRLLSLPSHTWTHRSVSSPTRVHFRAHTPTNVALARLCVTTETQLTRAPLTQTQKS